MDNSRQEVTLDQVQRQQELKEAREGLLVKGTANAKALRLGWLGQMACMAGAWRVFQRYSRRAGTKDSGSQTIRDFEEGATGLRRRMLCYSW